MLLFLFQQTKSDSGIDPYIKVIGTIPFDHATQAWTCFLNLGQPYVLITKKEGSVVGSLYKVAKEQLKLVQEWTSDGISFQNLVSATPMDVCYLIIST